MARSGPLTTTQHHNEGIMPQKSQCVSPMTRQTSYESRHSQPSCVPNRHAWPCVIFAIRMTPTAVRVHEYGGRQNAAQKSPRFVRTGGSIFSDQSIQLNRIIQAASARSAAESWRWTTRLLPTTPGSVLVSGSRFQKRSSCPARRSERTKRFRKPRSGY
jgi:hypothetical protein